MFFYTEDFRTDFGKWNGSSAEVLLKRELAGVITWQPDKLDVISLLKVKCYEITVKVIGSFKETFGLIEVR
jgi:hypothetical protein